MVGDAVDSTPLHFLILLVAKHECLRHIVPLGERHLRNVVREYVLHYHAERHHQGLGNIIPFPSPASMDVGSRIRLSQRLGGLLNFYDRVAA
jgi:hypothetical protein